MGKKTVAASVAGFVIVVIIAVLAFTPSYERYNIVPGDDGTGCREYYQECRCLGIFFRVIYNTPLEYECQGLELCWDISRLEC